MIRVFEFIAYFGSRNWFTSSRRETCSKPTKNTKLLMLWRLTRNLPLDFSSSSFPTLHEKFVRTFWPSIVVSSRKLKLNHETFAKNRLALVLYLQGLALVLYTLKVGLKYNISHARQNDIASKKQIASGCAIAWRFTLSQNGYGEYLTSEWALNSSQTSNLKKKTPKVVFVPSWDPQKRGGISHFRVPSC